MPTIFPFEDANQLKIINEVNALMNTIMVYMKDAQDAFGESDGSDKGAHEVDLEDHQAMLVALSGILTAFLRRDKKTATLAFLRSFDYERREMVVDTCPTLYKYLSKP